MKTKQCGTCEFWDRENAKESTQYINRKISACRRPAHAAIGKYETYNIEGDNCQVYKERQDAK